MTGGGKRRPTQGTIRVDIPCTDIGAIREQWYSWQLHLIGPAARPEDTHSGGGGSWAASNDTQDRMAEEFGIPPEVMPPEAHVTGERPKRTVGSIFGYPIITNDAVPYGFIVAITRVAPR